MAIAPRRRKMLNTMLEMVRDGLKNEPSNMGTYGHFDRTQFVSSYDEWLKKTVGRHMLVKKHWWQVRKAVCGDLAAVPRGDFLYLYRVDAEGKYVAEAFAHRTTACGTTAC
jgi:hypothetical protein